MSGNKREKQSIVAEPKIVIVLDLADLLVAAAARPANSGLDWTEAELHYYKIQIDVVPAAEFFLPGTDTETVALGHLDPAFLIFDATHPIITTTRLHRDTDTFGGISRLAVEDVNVSGANSALTNNAGPAAPSAEVDEFSEQTFYLLRHLRRASWFTIAQEGAIEDFSRELLRTLGFQTKHALLYTRYTIPFLVSGQSLTAQADISLVGTDNGSILLLLHKEIPVLHESAARIDPVPQLVAAAIAAFVANNKARTRKGKAALKEMVFPAIVMHNSRPKFFTIPVTAALKRAVGCGASPDDVTHVSQCHVSSPYELACGMETPAFRIRALRYFIAFKALAESLWNNY